MENFPAEYVRERLREIKTTYLASVVLLAQIAGYERSAMHRMLKNGVPNIFALHRLSEHFGVPMSFWFPLQVNSLPLPVPPSPEMVPEGEAPLTKRIVQAISKLPAERKNQVRKLIGVDSSQLDQLLDLATTLASVDQSNRPRFMELQRRLATMLNDEPVPP